MKSFGNIAKDGQVRAVASGALTDGTPVVVNSDGTVSVIGGTSRSQVLGTETVFESANSKHLSAAYDTTNDKVLIAYSDIGNLQKGTAIVGTVSGSTINFGSAEVFESGAVNFTATGFDPSEGRFLIAYRDAGDNNKGKAVVATISGTSVNFSSVYVFNSAGNTPYNSIVYDTPSGNMVITYTDSANNQYGTSVVATIDGASVSFGTPVVFASASTGWVNSVYDSNAEKVFIGFEDQGNGDYPTGIVGTVSGTSINFGSETVAASHLSNYVRVGFDSTNNKVVMVWRNRDDSDTGYAVVGEISGTSVSFGTPVKFSGSESVIMGSPDVVEFDTTSGGILIAYEDTDRDAVVIRGVISGTTITFDTPVVLDTGGGSSHEHIGLVYDPDEDRHVVFYKDGAESSYSTAIVYSPAYTTSNLTSENFIGFSDGAFADTDSAVINITNTIDRNQSSLTAGQTYFVQVDGTLSETADDPSVTAGTAISATELIVKG